MMKCLKVSLVILVILTWASSSFAGPEATPPPPRTQEEFFSTKGTIIQVDAEEKVLHVKIEGGLEATFHVDDKTVIKAGEAPQSFAALVADDSLALEYFYNENYEKVARTITKLPEPDSASAKKNQGPAT